MNVAELKIELSMCSDNLRVVVRGNEGFGFDDLEATHFRIGPIQLDAGQAYEGEHGPIAPDKGGKVVLALCIA